MSLKFFIQDFGNRKKLKTFEVSIHFDRTAIFFSTKQPQLTIVDKQKQQGNNFRPRESCNM
jgi:hypothetical protein